MERSKLFSTLLLVALVVFPSSLSPRPVVSSRLYFPHFVSGNDAETSFIISNSGAQDAEVRFTSYDDNGYPIAGEANPVTMTLARQSQSQMKVSELFKIANREMVTGWVRAESVNPHLSAWMVISLGDIEGDKLDGLEVSG